MNKFLIVLLTACVGLAAACTDAAKPPTAVKNTAPARPVSSPVNPEGVHNDDGHDAPRITLAEAKKHFDKKTAVFIDTHPPGQFAGEHIPGAINIQANVIKQSLDKIPKGKTIIAYCS